MHMMSCVSPRRRGVDGEALAARQDGRAGAPDLEWSQRPFRGLGDLSFRPAPYTTASQETSRRRTHASHPVLSLARLGSQKGMEAVFLSGPCSDRLLPFSGGASGACNALLTNSRSVQFFPSNGKKSVWGRGGNHKIWGSYCFNPSISPGERCVGPITTDEKCTGVVWTSPKERLGAGKVLRGDIICRDALGATSPSGGPAAPAGQTHRCGEARGGILASE
ncbi:hypothetical protein VTK73DRAFT_7916 [Phialemonium thermophilum]|uniref:Uncharacterized protein n=1 Tax=Phialemonium thermophilum TaxID=223376 RepID=A0ABR3WBX1_9PEZI